MSKGRFPAAVPAEDSQCLRAAVHRGAQAGKNGPSSAQAPLENRIDEARRLGIVKKEAIEGYGYQIVGSTPEHMDAVLKSEVARWAKVVKDSGAKVD